jgi:hypothetical protein
LAAIVFLAVAVPAAQAWVKTVKAAGDPLTTWTLTPRTITIRSANPALLQFIRGQPVLGCVRGRHGPEIVFWGVDASSITFHSARALPRNLGLCDAIDVGLKPGFLTAIRFSQGPFSSAWRKRLAATPPPGRLLARDQLFDYLDALSFLVPLRDLNLFGTVTRLPSAAALVRYADRRLSPARNGILYAPTLAGVTVPDVVYAIGHGWGRKKLEFAVIGFDGRRYVLHATLGNNEHPKFGLG